MKARFAIIVPAVVGLLLVGCSGASPSGTEPSQPASTHGATAELASCTGGSVPKGATKCLLDLDTGEDSYWMDTDGVDPGTAGCHEEYMSEACREVKPGRAFGELCLDEDRLVESNPGPDECHAHPGDLGKPDVVSCSQWCNSQAGTDGRCVDDVTAEGASGTCESARCECG